MNPNRAFWAAAALDLAVYIAFMAGIFFVYKKFVTKMADIHFKKMEG